MIDSILSSYFYSYKLYCLNDWSLLPFFFFSKKNEFFEYVKFHYMSLLYQGSYNSFLNFEK